MKKSMQMLYGIAMLVIIVCVSVPAKSQQFLTQVNGWNAYIHLPADYNTTSKSFPAILFFPGIGEIGTNAALVIQNGPGAYITQGWNGNVVIDANTVEFIVISLQPPTAYPIESDMNTRIQTLKSVYRIDNKKLYLTGLSMGGWCSNTFVTGDAYGGPYTYASQVAAVVSVEGVKPDDNKPYPDLFDNFARSGGRLICFEQSQDSRDGQTVVNRMNATVPNSAFFRVTNYGSGGHCCWEQFYGGSGQVPNNFILDGSSQNIYQWLAHQSSAGGTPSAPVILSPGTANYTAGSPFSYNIIASGSPTSYGATGLPSGLIVNATSGLISGTSSVTGTFTCTISATNAIGTASATLTIVGNSTPSCSGPMIVNAASAPLIDQAIDAAWSKAPVNAITKTVNGTMPPDFAGSQWRAMYDNTNLYLLVEVKDNNKINDSPNWWDDDVIELFIDGDNSKRSSYDGVNDFQFGFRYNDGVIHIGSNPANSTAGISFAIQNVTGGYNLEVAIPWTTLKVTPANGKAIGFDVEIDDDDNGGTRDATIAAFAGTNMAYANPGLFGTVNLTVCNGGSIPPAPVISSATTANGTTGTSFNYAITASNNPTSYVATGLPPGLTVNTSTGVISGTPTAAGTFNATISATNAGGTGTRTLTITINLSAPVISSAGTASGTTGTAFNYTITASNSPTSYGAAGLPAGLTINTATGIISGTPTASGTTSVTISATNASGTGTKTLTITINAAVSVPVVLSSGTASGTAGTAFSYNITASNSPTSYGATSLPAGLTVNTSSGLISGIPTASGTSNVTITATNTAGTGTKSLVITINTGGDPSGIITCYKASGAITVDGNLTETGWNITRSYSKNVTGTVNNTSTFGVLWDNTNLYIGVKVLDANLNSDSPNMWDDDAVEIYIDANNNKLTGYDGRDNQIIKGYNKSTIFTKLSITGLQHAWTTITGGYSVEMAIPWSELGITSPSAGLSIGFDVGNDDDDNAGVRDGQAVWNGTINNFQNTSAFGTLTLSGTVANNPAARTAAPSLSEQLNKNVIIAPNPVTHGSFTINLPRSETALTIEVSTIDGILLQREFKKAGNSLIKVSVPALNPGIYLLRLKNKNNTITRQLLIQ